MKKFKPEQKIKKESKLITIRLEKEIADQFNNLVEMYGANKSEFIRFLIKRELEWEGLNNGK